VRPRTRSFPLALAAIVVLALALRLVYSLLVVRDDPLIGDGLEFHLLANLIADGHGYSQPFVFQDTGAIHATADKAPLYPLYLSLFSVLGGDGWQAHQVAGALLGAGTVTALGFLGRRVGGDAVGLVAALIGAVYPMLVAADGSLRSESLYALLIALTLIAAYRFLDRPTPGRAATLGAAIALATLTRGEALALLLLLVPLARRAGVGWRPVAAAAAASALVLAPWLVRCWVKFDQPVLISTNVGGLLAGANCERTYHGDFVGQWAFECLPPPSVANEAKVSAELRDRGLDYASDHAGRAPVVAAVRVLRTWELYRPRQNAKFEEFFEGRALYWEYAGLAIFYALAALGVFGALVLRRREEPLAILLAPPLLVTLMSATGYGFTRFRVAAEIPIVVLAAVALVSLSTRTRTRNRRHPRVRWGQKNT
jgi:4-amino-4-deoxy-L-arabinose transferase-like glycosyltransferase